MSAPNSAALEGKRGATAVAEAELGAKLTIVIEVQINHCFIAYSIRTAFHSVFPSFSPSGTQLT